MRMMTRANFVWSDSWSMTSRGRGYGLSWSWSNDLSRSSWRTWYWLSMWDGAGVSSIWSG